MTIRNAAGSRAAKAKGRNAESAVVDYLRSVGIPAERRRLTGVADCGDIGGWADRVVEVKNEKTITLSKYMAELRYEQQSADARFHDAVVVKGPTIHKGCVVVKKRGVADAGEWYAVVPFKVMVELLR